MEPDAEKVVLMEKIHDGMRVLDVNGDDVGKVRFVQFSDPEAVTIPEDRGGGDPNVGILDVLDIDDDDDVSMRLRETGYIRIDARGCLTGDRFAGAEQIASVSGSDVHLGVSKDELS